MATLLRDPLEELITDLEPSLPPATGSRDMAMPPPFDDVQRAVHAVLGTDQDRARAATDSRVQAVLKHFASLGPARL